MQDLFAVPDSWPNSVGSREAFRGFSANELYMRSFPRLGTDVSPGDLFTVDPHDLPLLDVSSRNFSHRALSADALFSRSARAKQFPEPKKRPKRAGGRHFHQETKAEDQAPMRYIVAAVLAVRRVSPRRGVYRRVAELLAEPPANINRDVNSLRGSYSNARKKITVDEKLVQMFEQRLRLNRK